MPLSAKQMEYLALAWQCFEVEPKIDYEKFRAVAGLKSAASARELMRVTKNKLREEYGALSGSMRGANASPGKRAAAEGGTPSKANGGKKRGRSKKAAAEMEEGDEEDDVEETPVKKKMMMMGEVKVEEDEEEGGEGDFF